MKKETLISSGPIKPPYVDVLGEHQMARLDLDVNEAPNRFENYDGPSESKEPELDMLEVAESFIRNSNEEYLVFLQRVEENQNAIDHMINETDNEIESLATRLNRLQSRRDTLSQRLQELQRVRESGQKVRETLDAALYSDKEKVIRGSLLSPHTGRRLSDNPQA